ncbi:hypothetical protein Acsp06_50720 [Actinomycetospora sp. NBRC 106375]|nr:hypothetical protein Acsp06_50720 [Actinomycetospora sp. NBRC 106375]
MPLDWDWVRQRYEGGAQLWSLTGSAPVRVVEIDDDRICLSQSLWRDCVARSELEAAVVLLNTGEIATEPVAFAEALRRRRAHVDTGCTRGPNLTAIVLRDLGYLAS